MSNVTRLPPRFPHQRCLCAPPWYADIDLAALGGLDASRYLCNTCGALKRVDGIATPPGSCDNCGAEMRTVEQATSLPWDEPPPLRLLEGGHG